MYMDDGNELTRGAGAVAAHDLGNDQLTTRFAAKALTTRAIAPALTMSTHPISPQVAIVSPLTSTAPQTFTPAVLTAPVPGAPSAGLGPVATSVRRTRLLPQMTATRRPSPGALAPFVVPAPAPVAPVKKGIPMWALIAGGGALAFLLLRE